MIQRPCCKIRIEGSALHYVPKYRSSDALPAPVIFSQSTCTKNSREIRKMRPLSSGPGPEYAFRARVLPGRPSGVPGSCPRSPALFYIIPLVLFFFIIIYFFYIIVRIVVIFSLPRRDRVELCNADMPVRIVKRGRVR